MDWLITWDGGAEDVIPAAIGAVSVALLALGDGDDNPWITLVNDNGDVVWAAPRDSVSVLEARQPETPAP